MHERYSRRSFLTLASASIGVGALFTVRSAPAAVSSFLRAENGEAPQPFSFVQMSDTHVGFQGPPDPLGTRAFERAVEVVNGLPSRPDLVLFTGDLTHDSEKPGEHAARMKRFREIAGGLLVKDVRCVPGEHDAAADGGALYRSVFGETRGSFDQKGVHFVALDNVSLGSPDVGAEQLAWLKADLARFPRTAPIVVYTHRPLFDLAPDWEWYTGDGDEVMRLLQPFDTVTVLYGHIHRRDDRVVSGVRHAGARSLVFGFPDPAATPEKKALPFDEEKPFANLGLRQVRAGSRLEVNEVELTIQEHAGANGVAQLRSGGLL
jgi:3',5'-cyclic AMP phosphodiesterase CpdA